MSDQNDPMAEIRASFFIECEELLEALQDGLQELDAGSDDPETINIVFRAVHSIKGGAGAFGLESLVRFAHRYETVLDEVRSGKLAADSEAQKVFFGAADHLSDLVRMSRDGEDIPEDAGAALVDQLNALLGDDAEEEEVTADDFEPLGVALDLGLPDLDGPDLDAEASEPAIPQFRVEFRPEQEMFSTGNDPQLLLRNLAELGEATITCELNDLPPLEKLAPESTYFGWVIELTADVSEAEIRAIFEFVDGICHLSVEEIGGGDTAALPDLPPLDLPPMDSTPDADAPVETKAEAPSPMAEVEAPIVEEPPKAEEPAPAPPEPTAPEKPKAAAPAKPPTAAGPKSVVRVDLERIERLVNLVGELVINQAMLSQSLEKAGLSSQPGLEE